MHANKPKPKRWIAVVLWFSHEASVLVNGLGLLALLYTMS